MTDLFELAIIWMVYAIIYMIFFAPRYPRIFRDTESRLISYREHRWNSLFSNPKIKGR